GRRFTSSSTISPPTKPNWFANSSPATRASSFTSLRPILLGSTKSNSGSQKSSAKSSPVAFSLRSLTWLANSDVTSTPTPPTLAPSSGNTPTPLVAYVLTNSLRQATSTTVPGARTGAVATGFVRIAHLRGTYVPSHRLAPLGARTVALRHLKAGMKGG